ncbi:RNA polymerase sigma factor SigZ [Synechococcales cyanobacterium C]|uniref:RNA polymerase sigma factor SigZ n=1 Tax=Petrachloros mirabilis ULC683 TaxID=2781853 RepID=A0A8K2A152_9CYAN|nr:RNA polymerase sigma factor SigZ [Petrachloros mirabilis]NCJ07887.1 RNA polymerase sigma factor SigZ [Petrachloros mirabilis ULC683]
MDSDLIALWQAFHDRLYRFIQQRVQNPTDADDILQEVFLRIHHRLSTVRDRDRLVSWIFQIARHAVIDYYRAAAKQREVTNEQEIDLAASPWTEEEAVATLNQELATCLQPMLKALPASYQKAIALVELEGMTQKAAAEQLGLSLSGAKSRVQRGRQKLKAMLLQCCEIQRDRLGNVIDYQAKATASCGSKESEKSCCS